MKTLNRQLGPCLVLLGLLASSATWAERVASNAVQDPANRSTYWQSMRDGWFWYQDPLPLDDEPVSSPPPQGPKALTDQERDLAAHKDFQLRLENALNAAVSNPSEDNLVRFLELWAQARRKAALFTDNAQTLAARMPWVDETAQGTRPPNPAALRVFDQLQLEQKEDLMHQLAQTHGLYFFFRGDCAYCHAHAPMLKQFEQKFGFTVFAISLDGKGMPLYPQPARDNGMSQQVMQALRIPEQHFQVPFTVLANPRTHEVLPIGFGPMTATEMVDRIAMFVRSRQSGDNAGTGLPQPTAASAQPSWNEPVSPIAYVPRRLQ